MNFEKIAAYAALAGVLYLYFVFDSHLAIGAAGTPVLAK